LLQGTTGEFGGKMFDQVIPRIKVCFEIYGSELSFEEITNSIGIQPTQTRLKKDFPIASQDAGVASDRWQYVIDYQESMSMAEIIEQLVDLFQTTTLQILSIKQKFNAKCLIIVSVQAHETWMPCMTLSERCIDFAHKISSPIDFDIYCYSD
jgi:hypothetical protein